MSNNSPKPYPVVYDAETQAIQYYFQDGYFAALASNANLEWAEGY